MCFEKNKNIAAGIASFAIQAFFGVARVNFFNYLRGLYQRQTIIRKKTILSTDYCRSLIQA